MITGLRMLVICDIANDAERLSSSLLRAGYDVSLQWTNDEQVLRGALGKRDYDLVLCDDRTANIDIIAARRILVESGQDIPFIVISNSITPEARQIASQMKAGIDDFVEWEKPERLVPAVERAIHTVESRRQNRLAEQEMRYRANFDSLTELPNRALMMDRLAQAMKKAHRDQTGVLLMYLDLDHFKTVNDSMGHLAGDQLLNQAAKRLSSCLRDSDTAARIGGDEFFIILPGARLEATAKNLAGKLLQALSKPFELDGQEVSISASIGISVFPDDGEDTETLLNNADQAMYAAKKAGRNAFKVFSNLDNSDTPAQQATACVDLSRRKKAEPKYSPMRFGFAMAAAVTIVVIASVWLTSMETKESLKIAIKENLETLSDFTTAAGSSD